MPKTDAEIYAEDNEATLLALVELGYITESQAREIFQTLAANRESLIETPAADRVLEHLGQPTGSPARPTN